MARILVVDDEKPILEFFQDFCRSEHHQCRAISHALKAVDIALTYQPDLILLDVMMPDLNGFEVLARLRRHCPHIPVYLMSAHIKHLDNPVCLLGAQGLLEKPLDLPELARLLRHIPVLPS